MRRILDEQRGLVFQPVNHQHARELVAMSELLNEVGETARLVHGDLIAGASSDPRNGLRSGPQYPQPPVLRRELVSRKKGEVPQGTT